MSGDRRLAACAPVAGLAALLGFCLAAGGPGELRAQEAAAPDSHAQAAESLRVLGTPVNCPRDVAFWRTACEAARHGRDDPLSLPELRALAGRIDAHSAYFDWANDLDGLCHALDATGPPSPRRQVATQLAALYANLCAGEARLTGRDGRPLGLEAATRVALPGAAATTIGDLAATADRMLDQNRDRFGGLTARLAAVNRGKGIGLVCRPAAGP